MEIIRDRPIQASHRPNDINAARSFGVNLETRKYRRRSGLLPYIEIAIGSYFVVMIAFAIDTYNFFAIPFLLLFVAGYYWAGLGTLYQEQQSRLRWLKQRRLELKTVR